ncbi:MAG: hypothetical protein RL748_3398 [Pseudomonadota bacterium]|jgi:hypothetical protein
MLDFLKKCLIDQILGAANLIAGFECAQAGGRGVASVTAQANCGGGYRFGGGLD